MSAFPFNYVPDKKRIPTGTFQNNHRAIKLWNPVLIMMVLLKRRHLNVNVSSLLFAFLHSIAP